MFHLYFRMMLELQTPVFQLASSPLYAVRELSARALIPLIPIRSMAQFLTNRTRELPTENINVNQNMLHGRLLQIDTIVKNILLRWVLIVFGSK